LPVYCQSEREAIRLFTVSCFLLQQLVDLSMTATAHLGRITMARISGSSWRRLPLYKDSASLIQTSSYVDITKPCSCSIEMKKSEYYRPLSSYKIYSRRFALIRQIILKILVILSTISTVFYECKLYADD